MAAVTFPDSVEVAPSWKLPVIDWAARMAPKAVRKASRFVRDHQMVTLRPAGTPQGRLLLSYLIDPFLVDWDHLAPNDAMRWHSNAWECREMARAFLERGFAVDVMNLTNMHSYPEKTYDALIDTRHNLERLADRVSPRGLKIFHVDSANAVVRNIAENERILGIQMRRGVTLDTQRQEIPNRGMDIADCATVIGNRYTMGTFDYAHKPMYPVPISSPIEAPEPNKDFNQVRRSFLWLGTRGLVLKGLDLVLEAFAQMPDVDLYVCGPVGRTRGGSRVGAELTIEQDFEKAYHRELYETPNIHMVGWVDTASAEFGAIAQRCAGMVFAAASEGQNGGVISCMHWGLIPVISYEAGVDVNDYGFLFDSCSVEDIKRKVQEVAALPADDLETRARNAWRHARTHHTRENFAKVYRETVGEILSRA